jgi:hypothetical protein
MHIRSLFAAGVLLFITGTIPTRQASASDTAMQRSSASFAPVVIESFSLVHPKAGQHALVLVRFVNNNRPVAGARLTATVRIGKRTLMTLHGNATNRKGKAQAGFTVPAAARGKTVRVQVSLTYKGHTYLGRNDIKVQS